MTGTDVRVEPAREGPALRDFIRLPSRIYRDDPAWVPQLAFERKQYFSERNPVYREKQVALWTAYRDGRPVGRISAQASAKSPVVGHFGCLECEDDPATVDALFRTAEQWLASRGATQIAGPFSLSINDECGLLVEGFDDPPMAMMPHGRRYYDTHMRRQGLAKSADMLAYLFDLRQPFTPLAENMVKRAFRNPRISLRSIRPKDIGKNVISIMEIFNDGWRNNWGFEPMSPETARFIAEQMRHVLMDGMVWMADYDGQPAAIAVTMPNVNQALSPLRHSPAPIGILKTANISPAQEVHDRPDTADGRPQGVSGQCFRRRTRACRDRCRARRGSRARYRIGGNVLGSGGECPNATHHRTTGRGRDVQALQDLLKADRSG
jgi:hypothetical protein